MIALIIVAVHMIAWMATSDLLYRKWRAEEIDQFARDGKSDPVRHWEKEEQASTIMIALTGGFVWPLVLTYKGVQRITHSIEFKSEWEKDQERKELIRRNNELQREVDAARRKQDEQLERELQKAINADNPS